MTEENKRFIEVVDALKEQNAVTDYVELAETLDTNKASISDIKSGRKKLSLEIVKRMKLSYPQINVDWLLTGVGNMFIEDENNQLENKNEVENQKFSQKFSVDKDTLSIEDKLLDLINQKEIENRSLSQKLGYIQAQADIMRAHIASLPPQYSIPLPPSPDSLSSS